LKTCTKCKIEKSITDFNRKLDGHDIYCKPCARQNQKDWKRNNRVHQREYENEYRSNRVKDNRKKILSIFLENPCKDCGNKDIRVLEFDHLRDKKFTISHMTRGGHCWDSIKEEIDKCDVVCRNCHVIRSYERRNSWRMAEGKWGSPSLH